jgi:DNA-binding LacI/PurR family transcriptional regulator
MASTIYDVAERAGVSVSTVSLALNAPERVREPTLRRVMDAVDQLGFRPKAEAVSRARRGVRRIAVLAPFSSYPSFARRLTGVLRAAAGERFEVIVYDQESAATSRLVSLPLTDRVDGLIVMSLPFDDDVARRLAEQHLPTVLVDDARSGFSSVTTDDAAGGRMVAELLLRRGHEHVAFLGHAQRIHDYRSPSEARLDGFRAVLPAPPETRLVEHSFEAARAGAHDLLSASRPPTAIFAHDDLLAGGVLRAARERGIAVPTDLAVVGFDDSDIAEPLGLTSVHQPLEESGEIAAQILLDQLKDPGRSSRHTTLSLTVVERESTAS